MKRTARNIITSLFGHSRPFSDFVPAQSVLQVRLDAIAFVILRAVKEVKPGTILSWDTAVTLWARSYPKPIRSEAQRRLTEAWHRLSQQGLIAPAKVMGVYETWFVTELGAAALDRGSALVPQELLPRVLLVDRIADVAYERFVAGSYVDACAAAFKAVEVTV